MRIEDIICEIKSHIDDWKGSPCVIYRKDAKESQKAAEEAINALLKGNIEEALECIEEACRLRLIYEEDSTWDQSCIMLDEYIDITLNKTEPSTMPCLWGL